MSRAERPVVVIGAGLAGLSTAYHLQPQRPAVLLEREARIGGLTRSFRVGGFTFDITGHLLHLKSPEIRGLVEHLLPGGLARIERRSFIFSNGVYTDYPFQANLHGLPPGVIRDCLQGFVESWARRDRVDDASLARASFRDWALALFGPGIARHFMFPYNRKLWCREPEDITADWVSWAVPRPSLEDVIGGALGLTNRGLGYNPVFHYPVAGGIEVLPHALAAGLTHTDIRVDSTVDRIDPGRRLVHTRHSGSLPYDSLVSTLPLPALVRRIQGAPEEMVAAARGLAATRVLNVNLGIDRPGLTDKHWVYFPEEDYVFYRVGSPTAFCQASAPAGCSSLYIEVARRGFDPAEIPVLVEQVKRDLRRCGLLRRDDRIVAEQALVVDPAYVIFDEHRRQSVPRLLEWLRSMDIHSIGRYGRWEYGSMEDALRHGLETARLLLGAGDTTSEGEGTWTRAAASR